jgi:Uri superfamily endonuclease
MWSPQTELTNEPGTYALVSAADDTQDVPIGKLGTLLVEPGFYVYLGSAFGPGGLAARVTRHLRRDKVQRWHIDFLRPVVTVVEVWLEVNGDKRECRWATALASRSAATIPMVGFGSSDCACASHLIRFPRRPRLGIALPDAVKVK